MKIAFSFILLILAFGETGAIVAPLNSFLNTHEAETYYSKMRHHEQFWSPMSLRPNLAMPLTIFALSPSQSLLPSPITMRLPLPTKHNSAGLMVILCHSLYLRNNWIFLKVSCSALSVYHAQCLTGYFSLYAYGP